MKIITSFLMLVLLVFMILPAHSTSVTTPLAQAREETLIVGSEQDYPPFATGMTDKTAGGFTVELWKAVAAEAGLKYAIRVLPFRQLLQEFKEGKIDVLINLAISDERHQFADFSVPHVIVHGAIFVRKGEKNIRSEKDFSGKSIIVLNADLAHDYALSKGWGKQLVLVDTAAEGMKLLASGKYDAMLLSKLVGMQSLKLLNLTNVEPLEVNAGFSQKFAFAVPEGQSELLGLINEAMYITKSNGVYDALYEKWFGIYEPREPSLRDLLKYISPIIILFLTIAGYFYYKRQVERSVSEKELKESQERLGLATLYNGVGIWDWNLKTKALIWDDSMFALYQLSRDDFTAAVDAWQKSLHPDDYVRANKELEAAVTGGKPFRTEFRICWPNGNIRHIKAEARVFHNSEGQPVRMLGANIDITERKSREEKLKLAAKVFNHAAEGIIIADANGLMVDVNDAFTRITGYTREEVIGRNPSILQSGRQTSEFYADMWDAIANEGFWSGEVWNRRKDGQVNAELLSISKVTDDKGQVQNYIALFSDITKMKEHEHQLDDAILNAKQTLIAQQNFMAMLNHEIKTPLSVIRVTTGMQEITPTRKLRIQQSVLDIDAILDRCLKADQIDNASLEVKCQSCNINQMLIDVKSVLTQHERVEVTTNIPDVSTDYQLLHVVLSNLLDNALKYSKPKSTVQVTTRLLEINSRPGVLISVANKPGSAGMPDAQRVFEKYYRSPAAHSKSGSGLGLYLVNNIIKLLGGWVRYQPSGKMVKFELWLPV